MADCIARLNLYSPSPKFHSRHSQQTYTANAVSCGWESAPESGWIGEVIGVVGAEGVACTLPV